MTTSAPCASDGARACGGRGVRDVFVCRGGSWAADNACKETERCQTVAGKDQGTCQPMSAECSGQSPGVAFCDGDTRKVCDDLIASRVVACGNMMRCMPSATDAAGCSCMIGAFDAQNGQGCQAATNCTIPGGTCDPLTSCSMDAAGKPACTVCPVPYVGDGLQGCIPQLTALTPSCGALSPPLTSGVYQYRIKVPLLCQHLQLTAEAPGDTHVEIEGMAVEGKSWSSKLLQVGENPIKVAVTAIKTGKNSAYQLFVDRNGMETDYIKASNADDGDSFGFAVSADGNTVVVGAPYEDSSAGGVNGDQTNESAVDSGAAYVFVRNANSWAQQAYLKADAPAANDFFGTSVAISGDTIVVGAPRGNPMRYGILPSTASGIAYAYVRSGETWKLEGKLVPTIKNGPDLFGFHVAVDKDSALVGAPDESSTASSSGAVYQFTRGNGVWSETQRAKPKQPVANGAFGFSVALQGDTFVAGAPQDSTAASAAGAAYVFGRTNGMWTELKRFQAPQPKALATFGLSVALFGNRALVSAAGLDLLQRQTPPGAVYLLELTAGTWTQTDSYASASPRAVDLFGGSVAMSDTALVIGSNGDSSSSRGPNGDPANTDASLSGAAYVFGQQETKWTRSAYLKASNADAADAFAQTVAVTPDLIVVGAPFESSESKGLGGDPKLNGAATSGAVYVYR